MQFTSAFIPAVSLAILLTVNDLIDRARHCDSLVANATKN